MLAIIRKLNHTMPSLHHHWRAVKFRYTMVHQDRESFIKAVSAYLLNPQQKESLMPGAVTKFGVMPPTPLKEEQVKEIAAYLYDNDPAQPVWFDEHFKSMHGKGGQN
jgi:anti-sigma factor ChrR (cupin superfamily)